MRVEPIRSKKDIKNIKRLLQDHPRNLLLFVMGINSGLRTQDILTLRVKDMLDQKVGDRIVVTEKKTGKQNVIIINKEIAKSFQNYLEHCQPHEGQFLFMSRKGKNYPITTYRVTGLMKEWTSAINLKGNYGAHSLRKTFCYQQRVEFGIPWELLSKRLNHFSPRTTQIYIGVQNSEVEEILLNNI
ncbi:tyrosine-type recombinase/integrase [Maridesulfovibrio sp.]|uniref:tyrosine-type recombinase/integrase n=1 Tax=Maridesulfovibrio sp. TaxID=2795000 RepID=UPI002AA838B6|nr:tyrosine-type recombinase/integrase [Maridesulfovibrio sp.]